MQRRTDISIPRELRRSVLHALGAHVRAHLATAHFAHIQKLLNGQKRATTKRTGPGEYEIIAALAIYSVSISTLARKGLSAVQPNGWMVLVDSAHELTLLVEAQAHDNKYVVTRVSSGALVVELKKAMERSGKYISGSGGKRPQVCALRIPGMHFSAIWVHHLSRSNEDGIIPFTENFVGLKRQRHYTIKSAERRLQQHAINMILRWYDSVTAKQSVGLMSEAKKK